MHTSDSQRSFYMAFQGFTIEHPCSNPNPVYNLRFNLGSGTPIIGVYNSLSSEADVIVWMASYNTSEVEELRRAEARKWVVLESPVIVGEKPL